ncbi:MAG TPA: ChbG/HpnK family deacetylase [Terracidiphilus sp.]|nr:ChbG/HpnK family deacetylase [Terracidiphilus sp.]
MGRLIVNADDFGLTAGVNRAIVELYREGVLTSTTLMANAAATVDALALARSNPGLGIGCHVVLADGEPVLPPNEVPTLIDRRTGCFPPKLTTFLRRLFTGQIRSAEIEAEAAAQIASLQSRGLQLTHVDTHKHTHMFPAVLRPVLRAARAAGIQTIRNPFEPEWAVRATPRVSVVRSAEVWALRRFGPYFQRVLAEEGFSTTDGTIAVAATGVVNAGTVRSLLGRLPEGTWELVTHPGYNDADLAKVRTRLRASRDIERLALSAIREFPSLDLISFAGLRTAPQPFTR